MAWEHTERRASGNGELSRNSRDELNYYIQGDPNPATDDADNPLKAIAYAVTFVLGVYNGNQLDTLAYDRAGPDGLWFISIRYRSDWIPTGESTFTFNTAGGTQHIRHALSHVQTYGSGGQVSTEQDGWLNVDDDYHVQGLDLPTAAFGFQITMYVEPSALTESFVGLLFNLTDTVNNATFTATAEDISLTFEPGECRFDGATGSRRGYGDFELTLNFSASPNKTNFTVGTGNDAISGVTKNGWDYLATRNQLQVDDTNHFIAPKLQFVFVDQVFDYENFTGLIPGTPSEPFGGGGPLPT